MEDLILIKNTSPIDFSKYGNDYFVHLLCHSGKGKFKMENKVHEIAPDNIVIWLPSIKINDVHFSGNFKATFLFISFNLMSKNNPDAAWGTKGFLFSKENPVVKLSKKDFKKCLQNFDLLDAKYKDENHHFRTEILNLTLQIFVMEIWNIFYNEFEKQKQKSQNQPLFQRFLQQIQQDCMEHREVEYFAKKLFISPKYLNEISKKNSGKTASEWIETYTKQRLIILLRNPNLTLTEVAEALNFSSLSFFSRYVKKLLKVSPSEYRKQLK